MSTKETKENEQPSLETKENEQPRYTRDPMRIANESEKNPPLVSLEGHKSRGNLQPRKGKNLPQVLFQSSIQNVKRNVETVNLLQIVDLREKSPQKLHYTQRRKKNIVKGEDEIILQLLGIHSQLMEMIRMTHNIRVLK